MRAYAPRTPSEVLELQMRGGGPPAPLDDVGLVVRDAGAGLWRGLLVRTLGSTQVRGLQPGRCHNGGPPPGLQG